MRLKLLVVFLSLFAFTFSTVNATPTSSFFNTKSSYAKKNEKLAKSFRQKLFDRFITYTTHNSQSSETEAITQEQIDTAHKLMDELTSLGIDAKLTEHYYIVVDLPSNLQWNVPVLGFSCHYDTTPDNLGKDIKAQVIEKYDGNPIILKNNQVIDPSTEKDAYLATQVGKKVVTSDGTTILSADDKAGLSVIVTLLETLVKNPSKPHGRIQVVIAPNEDVGRAAQYIEETGYNPDIAFDFDGGSDGRVVAENFNAESVIFTVKGTPGHQSYAATNGYRNAWKPACKLGDNICRDEDLPNMSTGDQGYAELHHKYYPENQVSTAMLDIRLRGFDQNEMNKWKERADSIAETISKKYEVAISKQVYRSYGNVGEALHASAMEALKRAFHGAKVEPKLEKMRAGTTASMFLVKTGKGALTIFTGQNNPHALTEWLSEEDMFKSYLIALNLVDEVAQLK
jgi:tripeptide aminopeptidase